jgi:uncharacterized repeat protein (TIGR03803 family)
VTRLYGFKRGTDGAMPVGALLLTKKGMLFGATSAGGTAGFGTVFPLAPPTQPGGTVFQLSPPAPPGGLYGTTEYGGAADLGTVFQSSF